MAASVVAPVLEALEHLSKLGLPGQIGYVLALSAWTALCLPTTPIELTAGFCFSKHVAMITSASGKTLGNVLALFLGRTFLQPLILRQLDSRPSWRRYHKHLLRELHELPIQTMSTLRAALPPRARHDAPVLTHRRVLQHDVVGSVGPCGIISGEHRQHHRGQGLGRLVSQPGVEGRDGHLPLRLLLHV